MSVLTNWDADWIPLISTRLRTGVAALGIAVIACVTGVVGIVVAGTVLRFAGVLTVPAVSALQLRSIQVGFTVFAAVFLAWRGDLDHYCKLRLPTLEDAAWIIFIPLVFAIQGVVLPPVLAALGLPHPDPVAGTGHVDLATEPLLWPAAFLGMFVFAAPAEELVYRGIIQGTLRKGFNLAGVVVSGGLLFGLMHILVGLFTPDVGMFGALRWGITTALPGMVWGYAYERTENLAVTAITHAMTWTVTVHELVLNLVPV
ncbi:CPBP family intramembrane glutamic endopeptidase (plasmid) [Haloarcula sp. NS06]|uniref:CPBP family intramembrane glutamic endopeptidase n=1 Tax=Haloarcula sp. NS06 TaxID=3409688 RepID=UPI003DA70E92